jgi:hypothetical protein
MSLIDGEIQKLCALERDIEAGRLDAIIRQIGIARFVGRINFGVIDSTPGYKAIKRLVSELLGRKGDL